MQWLNPYALLLLPLVAAVLLLARRRIVRVRRAVSAPFLWTTDLPSNPLLTLRLRLKRHWLLAVQAAFMLTLVAALAGPVVSLGRPEVDFLFDVSASMGARSAGTTRLELAQQAAVGIARALPRRTRIRVWTTDAGPAIETSPSGLRAAIANLRPSDGEARLTDTIDAVRAEASGPHSIFVFTDSPPPAPPTDIRWTTVGGSVDNVAIVALAGRQVHDPEAATEIVVGIRNFGTREVDVPFEVRHEAAMVTVDRVHLAARAGTTVTIRRPPLAGAVTARLTLTDGLAADNVRFALLPPATARRTLLITAGNYFLERALASNPSVIVDTAKPGSAIDVSGYDLAVCDDCGTPPSGLPAFVVTSAATDSAPAPLRIVTRGHPLGRFVDAGSVDVTPIPAGPVPAGTRVIAAAGGMPVILASDAGGRRTVELRTRLENSPLALAPAFPIFVANAVSWLTRQDENPSTIVAGDTLRWSLTGTAPVSVLSPDGQPVASAINNQVLSVTALSRAGIYDVRIGDRHQPFAVNPATGAESDLSAPVTPVAPVSNAITTVPARLNATVVLIAVALLLLAVETALSAPLSRGARAFRVSLAAALVAGMVAPPSRWGAAPLDVMFLLDRSASMTDEAAARAIQQINAATNAMTRRDRSGLIVFGGTAAIEQPLAASLRVSTVTSRVSAAATNLEAALRLARLTLGDRGVRRAVLVSDGLETVGDAAREVAEAAAAGIPIDVVTASAGDPDRTSFVEGITAPAIVRTGEPFVISLGLRGRPGSRPAIDLARDGQLLATIPVTVDTDGSAFASWSDVARSSGTRTYTASVALPGGPEGLPDAGTAVTVEGPPTVLYVSEQSRSLPALLEAGAWRVRTTGIASLPTAGSALREFDAVILEGVDGDQLTSAQAAALAQYVENDAGGLLVLGAPSLRSYSTGALSRILPVDVRPQNGTRRPGMALVLAFDKSGSMADAVGGVSKIELARQSVIGALQAIPPTDLFGAIAFDAAPTVVTPLAAGTDAAAVARRLRGLEARGSTSIAPAIDLAESWLRAATVAKRRVLLVSDGRTQPADIDRLRTAVRAGQFELSVVAIGDDADRALLTSLAAASGGRAYFPADVSELPKIVARDAAAASGGTEVRERFAARLVPHPVTRGLDSTTPPQLAGYAVTAAKRGADVVMSSHLDDPLLAAWRAGLGRVAVFTSDLRTDWAASMRQWDGFGAFWRQMVRWVGRQASASNAILTLQPEASGIHLLLSFNPASGAERLTDASVSVRAPSGEISTLTLTATAPGRFEGTAAAREEGTYVVTVRADRADGDATHLTQGVYWAGADEHPGPPNEPFLASIARATGGRVLAPGDNPFAGDRPGEPRDVRWLFTTLALVAFMIDILRRRGLFATPSAGRHAVPTGSASPRAAA